MPAWPLLLLIGSGFAFIVGRGTVRRRHQTAAANAAGLVPVADLTHLPQTLQRTGLWALADGGFERRVMHGVIARRAHDIDVTAFDLETLRDRRGEWAWLPLDTPFRIGPVISIVVCETDLVFPHTLLKRAGLGDDLEDDNVIERTGHIAKAARTGLGLARSYAAELPKSLPSTHLDLALPEDWRAYGIAGDQLASLLAGGLAETLERVGRRDLVVELLDTLILVYPAALAVAGADALADLTTTALAVADGLLAASLPLSPRGVEPQRA